MATVRLKWRRRVAGDQQRVFRSTAPFDADSLPASIATLDADVEAYEDTSAPLGVVYYAIGTVLLGSPLRIAVSAVISINVADGGGGSGSGSGGPVLEFPAPLQWDEVSGLGSTLVSVYSLVKRVSDYVGACVRILDTFDNSEQDVGFDANGELEEVTVTGLPRVLRWYDQFGGADLVAADATRAPLLRPRGARNGRPTIDCGGPSPSARRLDGPFFGAGAGTHKVARPWLWAALSPREQNQIVIPFSFPVNRLGQQDPFLNMGLAIFDNEQFETRFAGTSLGNFGRIGGKLNKYLQDAGASSLVSVYVDDPVTAVDSLSSSADMYQPSITVGRETQLQVGSNASFLEPYYGCVQELIFCAPGAASSSALREIVFDEMDAAWGNVFVADTEVVTYEALEGATACSGWGMVKRNPSYTGPALRVADNASAAEVDVDFDAAGFVRGAAPYGANTRVITFYDQWGSEHLTVAKTAGIGVVEDDAEFNCWRLSLNEPSAALQSPSFTNSVPEPPWRTMYPVWAMGLVRTADPGLTLRNIWGVPKGSSFGFFMGIGLWEEGQDLHWRVNGSDPLDWRLTDWTLNPEVQNTLTRVVADCGRSLAQGHHNAVLDHGIGFISPVTYDNGRKLSLGGNGSTIGLQSWRGQIVELHLFEGVASSHLPPATVEKLDRGLRQVEAAFYTP